MLMLQEAQFQGTESEEEQGKKGRAGGRARPVTHCCSGHCFTKPRDSQSPAGVFSVTSSVSGYRCTEKPRLRDTQRKEKKDGLSQHLPIVNSC